jgi:hypothetical protein
VTLLSGISAEEKAFAPARITPGSSGNRGRPRRDQVLEVGRLYRPLYHRGRLGASRSGLPGRQAVRVVNQKGKAYELAIIDFAVKGVE